jgi:glycosyltransferase involved in cell wall biosynthesis
MKIFAAWVVKNEDEKIRESLESLLPYVDSAILIDTGSTDKTLEIVKEVHDNYFHNLQVVTGVDIGPDKNMSIALTIGLNSIPTLFKQETCWYMVIAGDEVFDSSIKDLRSMLEKVPESYLWIYSWFRNWSLNEATGKIEQFYSYEPSNSHPHTNLHGRPLCYRYKDGMYWEGHWNEERILYPDVGSYFRYNQCVPCNNLVYFDSKITYDHYAWSNKNRYMRQHEYERLRELSRLHKIPCPKI